MKSRYVMFAAYNAWANERLYEKAATLSDADYRQDRGAFFGSVHGTLNHLLVADLIWMRRFTGTGDAPSRLDAIPHEDFESLRVARQAQDERITRYIDGLGDADFTTTLRYRTISNPIEVEQMLWPSLDHFFNHQTHHRGQAHCLFTQITGESPSFDMLIMQRKNGIGAVKKMG